MIRRASAVLLGTLALAVACGGEQAPPRQPASPPPVAVAPDAGPPDPLGPRPEVGEPALYTPPVPVSYERDGGLRVWLLARHAVPLVSMQLVVPAGSAYDPEGKEGLAAMTANMLDEGAGARGPLEIARDIDRLGATLRTGAQADYAYVHLTTLKKNLAPALEIFGDVVARPRMSPVEFKRVHDLWTNQLRARQSDPQAVASVVVRRKVYQRGPYAHPVDGTLASAAKVGLDDVKKLYASRWRPDKALLVVVGDVTREELDPLLDRALGSWKAPKTPPPPDDPWEKTIPPSSSVGDPPAVGRRVFVVDRPDAPQSVIAVGRTGPGGSEARLSTCPLVRVNAALGGSFTSRLNQKLREEHGWSYGARSRFEWNRVGGAFVASAAVHTEHTGEALAAMIAEIEGVAKNGLTEEETAKTRQLARAELVETFETIDATAVRLARTAGVGLTPQDEVQMSRAIDGATRKQLNDLAGTFLDLSRRSVVVIVGPRAKIEPQLAAIGITNIERATPEGD